MVRPASFQNGLYCPDFDVRLYLSWYEHILEMSFKKNVKHGLGWDASISFRASMTSA